MLTTFLFKCHVSFYATLQRAAIYFTVFLHKVSLQMREVKSALLWPSYQLVVECLQAPLFPNSTAGLFTHEGTDRKDE